MDECRFCAIHSTNEVKAVSDTILYENAYFFVIPALGCFVKDYIMIVSKRHIHSMCYLNSEEKKSLEDLINKFRTILKEKYRFYPLVFEHGAAREEINKSACCVLHAHIHIVPHRLNNQNEMIASLGLKKADEYRKFYSDSYDKSYVFFMDNAGVIFYKVLADDALPSQIIRKWIASDLGRSDEWDWKTHPFDENVVATIDDLKPIIKDHHGSLRDTRMKYVYYCCAMDGLETADIGDEYARIQNRLADQGRVLVNPFNDHMTLELTENNADMIVKENLTNISKADCVVVNLSIKYHTYVGCIAEMVYAKLKGCYVIAVCGDSGVDKHFYTLHLADRICSSLDELFSLKEWYKQK
jgi:diadenosine tetraphosphate (Ap4A) HIT family hydrolase